MVKKDGERAFPRPSWGGTEAGEFRDVSGPQDGMSLRDYFAGQALAGYIAAHSGDLVAIPDCNKTAERVYAFADAMLSAREQEPAPPPGPPAVS